MDGRAVQTLTIFTIVPFSFYQLLQYDDLNFNFFYFSVLLPQKNFSFKKVLATHSPASQPVYLSVCFYTCLSVCLCLYPCLSTRQHGSPVPSSTFLLCKIAMQTAYLGGGVKRLQFIHICFLFCIFHICSFVAIIQNHIFVTTATLPRH